MPSSPRCRLCGLARSLGRLLLAAAVLVCVVAAPAAARADMIADWTAHANALAAATSQSPLTRAQTLAILHVAMFEAMNVVERRDTPHKLNLSADGDVSLDAAAASAAQAVLVALYPAQAPELTMALSASLAAIPNDVPKVRGFLLGKEAAAKVLVLWRPRAAAKQDVARQRGEAAVASP